MPEPQESNREKLKRLLASPYVSAGSALLPAALTYVLSRRVGKMAPEHAQLGESIRARGLGVVAPNTAKMSRPEAWTRFGTPHVKPEAQQLKPGLGAVYHPSGSEVGTSPQAFGHAAPHPELNHTKRSENEYMRFHMGEHVAPPTHSVEPEVAQMFGHPADARLQYLDRVLRAKHPNGYVLKPNLGTGSKPLTDQHNLVAEHDKLAGIDGQLRHPITKKTPSWNKSHFTTEELMQQAKADPYLFFELTKNLPPELHQSAFLHGMLENPELMVSQDRLNLAGELRIHALGSRIIRRATVARHNKLAGIRTLMGFKNATEKQVETEVEHLMHRLPKTDLHERPFAMDVGYSHSPDGKINVHMLDMNAGSWSGLLHSDRAATTPGAVINANKYFSELAGRDTVPLAGAKAVSAGIAGRAALGGARAIAGPPDEEPAV